MRTPSYLLLLVLLVTSTTVTASDWPYPIPDDRDDWFGDPERGPEPDPARAQWLPPHTVTWPVNDADPLTGYGHFRLQDRQLRRANLHVTVERSEIPTLIEHFETRDWGDGSLLRVSIMLPDERHQQPSDGWPLIIYCPGSGDVGRGAFERHRLDPALAWATPAFREHLPAVVMRMHPMERTVHYNEATNQLGGLRTSATFDAYMAAIEAMIASGPVDPNRVSVYGFSMGGSTTWALIQARPDLFAAAAPSAGQPPATPEAFQALANTPIWMSMGNQDPWKGSSHYIWAYAHLRRIGNEQVRFWEVQDRAHANTTMTFAPLAIWLYQQRRDGARR